MKYFLSFIFLVIVQNSIAQKYNTIYLELGGKSFYGTITYDCLVIKHKNSNYGFSIGLGTLPLSDFQSWAIPISINLISNANRSHHLELGAGLTYHLVREKIYDLSNRALWLDNHLFYLNSTLGYRYQQIRGGLFLKANINLMIGVYNQYKQSDNYNVTIDESKSGWFKSTGMYPYLIMPWGGIGIGYTF